MNKRSADRFESNIPTVARVPATLVTVTILDLSTSGCKLQTSSKLAQVGATIIMSLTSQLDVGGRIVWQSDDTCGVEFDIRLHQELILDLTKDANSSEWFEEVQLVARA